MNTKVEIICPKHDSFWQEPQLHLNTIHGCSKCAKETTKAETEISDFLHSYLVTYANNDRTLIKPKELDIIIPNHKLAIEFNGMLWHSYGITYPDNFNLLNKKYHLVKTELVESKDFNLFHIFENEWADSVKQNIWKSMILNKLNLIPGDNTIYARKCQIIKVSSADARIFLDNNHLQGASRVGTIRLGLMHNNKLVSLMTFSKPSIAKSEADVELIRFCNLTHHVIVGGASKLLKHFERNYKPKSIVSYANRRWSKGDLYEKLGFEFKHNSMPNYFYFKGDILYSRNSFQKHKLKDKLKSFDGDLSELQNMMNNGYRVIYDSGNKIYVKKYEKKENK
jgi:G:T-mismatch repair DNA endonuclease (very short patch repair protein)